MARFRIAKWAYNKFVPMRDEDLVPTNNLATGTASSSSYLRGDQTWQPLSGIPVSSATQAALDNKVYSVNVLTTQFSPANGQTVYAGYYPALTPSTLAGSRRMIIPKTGTIVGLAINFFTNGTVGTAESIAMSIRLSDGTVTPVTSVAIANAHRIFFSSALNIPVIGNGTNYFEVQFTYPTWATPPTNVHIGGSVLIRS